MVFSTTNLFKGIACPEGERCSLTSCIFAHAVHPEDQPGPATRPISHSNTAASGERSEPAAKRRRITYEKPEDKPTSRADVIRDLLHKKQELKGSSLPSQAQKPQVAVSTPPSLTRTVSPPPKANGKPISAANTPNGSNQSKGGNGSAAAKSTTQPAASQAVLNPRLIPNDPAGHAKRSLILKYLHAEMARLNHDLRKREKDQPKTTNAEFILNATEVIELALDEEEKIARGQPAVYGNVIKNRIAVYKKMKLEDWLAHIKTTPLVVAKEVATIPTTATPDPPKPIDTGLSAAQEVAILPRLVIKDQKPLAKYGYIPIPPTIADAEKAAAAVQTSANYEICDRCAARYQVWPTRNEAGLLTSNGPCRHHPNRKVYPQRNKADLGPQEAYYPCCNEVVGSPGCTTNDNHVFKASSPARLAAVMPFITTPENDHPALSPSGKTVSVVCFDCEMGYTTLGLELIRLTAVSWPEGEALVDILVRPLGIVLDLNSRFSGVWPETFTNAKPFTTTLPPPTKAENDSNTVLPIAGSPAAARSALLAYLTPSTPLLGHAIENDLNVVRLCHPSIVDTVVLFPHPRRLPMRNGLRTLTSRYLKRSIQTGGERGHDSLEDARATGELVRWKLGEKWKLMKGKEWRFDGDVLIKDGENKSGAGGMGFDGANDGGADDSTESEGSTSPDEKAGKGGGDEAKAWQVEGVLGEGY